MLNENKIDIDKFRKYLSAKSLEEENIVKIYNNHDDLHKIINEIIKFESEINIQKERLEKHLESIKNIQDFIKNENIVFKNAMCNEKYIFNLDSIIDTNKQNSSDFSHLVIKKIKIEAKTIENNQEYIFESKGDYKIKLYFTTNLCNKLEFEKEVMIKVLEDTKNLWKCLPSDKSDPLFKEDNYSTSGQIGDKFYIASSKRGRSHQHEGTFRDDHCLIKTINNDWSIIAVADGAGSAKFSRWGSKLACEKAVEYCLNNEDFILELQNIEKKLTDYSNNKDNDTLYKNINNDSKKTLYRIVKYAYDEIEKFSKKHQLDNPEEFDKKDRLSIAYFHTTLIFTIFKKIDNLGYVFFNFGVGDCPIVLLVNGKPKLLNALDIGEYGGGTRFLTMREIYMNQEDMSKRFTMDIFDDFDYLFLMTDGIYDPKFEVESNLVKEDKWNEFIVDLQGNNEDSIKINFSANIKEDEKSLNNWLDFWNKGNHDDRTIAIVYGAK